MFCILDSIRCRGSSRHERVLYYWYAPCCGPRSYTAAFDSRLIFFSPHPFFPVKEGSHVCFFALGYDPYSAPLFLSCCSPYPVHIIRTRSWESRQTSGRRFALLVAQGVFVWRPAWFLRLPPSLRLSARFVSVGACVNLGLWSMTSTLSIFKQQDNNNFFWSRFSTSCTGITKSWCVCACECGRHQAREHHLFVIPLLPFSLSSSFTFFPLPPTLLSSPLVCQLNHCRPSFWRMGSSRREEQRSGGREWAG